MGWRWLRQDALGVVLLLLVVVVLVVWSSSAERDCDAQGGWMAWERDRAASTAYGECVGREP